MKRSRIFRCIISMMLIVLMCGQSLIVHAYPDPQLNGNNNNNSMAVFVAGGWGPNYLDVYLTCTPYIITRSQASTLQQAEEVLKQYLATTVNPTSNCGNDLLIYPDNLEYSSAGLTWYHLGGSFRSGWSHNDDRCYGVRSTRSDLKAQAREIERFDLAKLGYTNNNIITIEELNEGVGTDWAYGFYTQLAYGTQREPSTSPVNNGNVFSESQMFINIINTMKTRGLLQDSAYQSWISNYENPDSADYLFIIFTCIETAGGSDPSQNVATTKAVWWPDGTVSGKDKYSCGTIGLTPGTGNNVEEAFLDWYNRYTSSSDAYVKYGWPTDNVDPHIYGTIWTELSKVNSFNIGNQYYFGRTYWGGGDTGVDGDFLGDYGFAVEASPKDRSADLSNDVTCDYYKVHLQKGSAAIDPNATYTVIIKAESQSKTHIRNEAVHGWFIEGTDGPSIGDVKNTKLTLTSLTGEQLQAWCNGSWFPYLMITSAPSTPRPNSIKSIYKFSVTIKKSTGKSVSAIAMDDNKYNGWDKVDNTHGTNYVSWVDGGVSAHIPWEFHTNVDPHAYAEIVANAVGTDSSGNLLSDWNVMQGIPSTETLSIAGGGTMQMADLAGFVHIYGEQLPDGSLTTLNAGKGAAPTRYALKRLIELDVIVQDWWGEDNTPCALSCPSHTVTKTVGNATFSCGDGYTCPHCGEVIAPCGKEEHTHSAACNGGTKHCSKEEHTHMTQSHSCVISATYNCASNSGNPEGSAQNGGVLNSGSLQYNQYYNGSYTTKDHDGCEVTASSTNPGLLCQGYTTGKGCTHSGNRNCAKDHHDPVSYKYYIQEYLDIFAYKEITRGAVWVLTDMEITNVDENVISESAIGRAASVTSGQDTLLRMPGFRDSDSKATTNPYDAHERFMFTTFNIEGAKSAIGSACKDIEPEFRTSNEIGQGTYYVSPGHTGWWKSNTTVLIYVEADSSKAQTPTGLISSLDAIANRGIQDQTQWNSVDSNSTEYKKNYGSMMSETNLQNYATNVVNAFQYGASDGLSRSFTVAIQSDAYELGTHWNGGSSYIDIGAGYQSLVNGCYCVDSGIQLFDAPFTVQNEVHNRTHRSDYNQTQLANMKDSFGGYMLTTDVGNIGYNGHPSSNPSEKYTFGLSSSSSSNNFHKAEDLPPCAAYFKGFNSDYLETCYPNVASAIKPVGTDNDWSADCETDPNEPVTGRPWVFKNTWAWSHKPADVELGEFGSHDTQASHVVNGYYSTFDYKYDELDGILIFADSYDIGHNDRKYVIDGNYGSGNSITDNGEYNAMKYQNPFVISNIDIKDTAPNGLYSDAITVTAHWRKITEWNSPSSETGDKAADRTMYNRETFGDIDEQTDGVLSRKAVYSDTYVNASGQSSVINDIVIHDPISVQYTGILGNNYGSYAAGVIDESGEDARVKDDGKLYSDIDENMKPNYVVVGNTFHIWFSDFGDFYDLNGSWSTAAASNNRGTGKTGNACDPNTGKVLPGGKGYMDNMNTGIWVNERFVSFTVPVSYTSKAGKIVAVPAYTAIPLSNVQCIDSAGNKGIAVKDAELQSDGNYKGSLQWVNKGSTMFHAASDALQNFSNTDANFRFGLDYEFTLLPSAEESKNAECYFYTEAINDVNGNYPLIYNNKQRTGYSSETTAKFKDDFEVVGRIGNLAIEDTGDFRFSELFKQAIKDSWLIDGVIHDTDIGKPNTIIATPLDILGNNTTGKVIPNHAQGSVTNYLIGSELYHGKAGAWLPFPLVPSYNPVQELRGQALRFGYDVYLDVETMGNYYGINSPIGTTVDAIGDTVTYEKGSEIERGPEGPEELNKSGYTDTRTKVMDIYPMYYLYDNGKYYAINLYYGNPGGRTLFWSPTQEVSNDMTALYVDLPSEGTRRNTTTAEEVLTKLTAPKVDPISVRQVSCFTGADFIGTSHHIRLDAFDRSYIGSNVLYGAVTADNSSATSVTDKLAGSHWIDFLQGNESTDVSKFTGGAVRGDKEGTADSDFAKQSQRWYFTLGTPSSTYVTYAGTYTTQTSIEAAHDRLMEQHPDGVIVSFLNITVKGDVWTLKYQAPMHYVGDEEMPTLPNTEARLEVPKDDTPVYDADNKVIVGLKIPKGSQPVAVYEPEVTSSDDWDTFGSH